MKNKTNRAKLGNISIYIAFLLVAVFVNFFSSWIIQKYFPERVAAPDLMFKILPNIPFAQYLTDIFNILSFILIFYYLIKYKVKEIRYFLLNFSVAYMLRGLIIILTPLGGINGNEANYGITAIKQYGAFPSGHTIMVTMAYMLISNSDAPILKKLALISVLIEIISLLISRGHYSIDIVGGLLLSYFVYHELTKYRDQLKAIHA